MHPQPPGTRVRSVRLYPSLRPGARTPERRRPRAWLAGCLAAASLCAALAPAAAAAAAPNPYEGTVAGEAGETSRAGVAAEALRQVAVRATGRRAAATDPALAALYANARQYVQTLTPAGPGQVTVGFDASAVEAALARAGQPLWAGERPVTLALLTGANGQLLDATAAAPTRRALERTATTRGVTVLFPTRTPSEQLAPRLDDYRRGETAGVLELAQRYGAEELLVCAPAAEPRCTALGPVTLATPAGAEDALNALVDRYAADGALAPGTGLAPVPVVVHGIVDVRAYAAARRALESIAGVHEVTLGSAQGEDVHLAVVVRGGGEVLRRALAGNARLGIQGASGGEELELRLSP